MLRISYCPHCKERIFKERELAFRVFETISSYYYVFGSVLEFNDDIDPDITGSLPLKQATPILNWLEGKRLILTTETDLNSLCAKPLHFSYHYDELDHKISTRFCLQSTNCLRTYVREL